MNRLITTKELLECYRVKTPKTLWDWTKRDENPLPKSLGNSIPKIWHESDIQKWELATYGREIISAYLDRRDALATQAKLQPAQPSNGAGHTSANHQGVYDRA